MTPKPVKDYLARQYHATTLDLETGDVYYECGILGEQIVLNADEHKRLGEPTHLNVIIRKVE
jgi:hypothetical protein